MRVKATAVGYDNVAVRNPGDEFDMPDGVYAPWYEPLDAAHKAKSAKAFEPDAKVPAVNPARQQSEQEAARAQLAAGQKAPAVEPPKKP